MTLDDGMTFDLCDLTPGDETLYASSTYNFALFLKKKQGFISLPKADTTHLKMT